MRRVVGALAAAAGHATRLGVSAVRYVPGIAAPLLVVYGVHQIYAPVAWVCAGFILWYLDWRTG